MAKPNIFTRREFLQRTAAAGALLAAGRRWRRVHQRRRSAGRRSTPPSAAAGPARSGAGPHRPVAVHPAGRHRPRGQQRRQLLLRTRGAGHAARRAGRVQGRQRGHRPPGGPLPPVRLRRRRRRGEGAHRRRRGDRLDRERRQQEGGLVRLRHRHGHPRGQAGGPAQRRRSRAPTATAWWSPRASSRSAGPAPQPVALDQGRVPRRAGGAGRADDRRARAAGVRPRRRAGATRPTRPRSPRSRTTTAGPTTRATGRCWPRSPSAAAPSRPTPVGWWSHPPTTGPAWWPGSSPPTTRPASDGTPAAGPRRRRRAAAAGWSRRRARRRRHRPPPIVRPSASTTRSSRSSPASSTCSGSTPGSSDRTAGAATVTSWTRRLLDRLADPSPGQERVPHASSSSSSATRATRSEPSPTPRRRSTATASPSPRETAYQWLTVTPIQYGHLARWAAGDFVDDRSDDPAPTDVDQLPVGRRSRRPLDRAGLDACLGGAYHPGIEVPWSMRVPSMWAGPLRLDVRSTTVETHRLRRPAHARGHDGRRRPARRQRAGRPDPLAGHAVAERRRQLPLRLRTQHLAGAADVLAGPDPQPRPPPGRTTRS